MLKYYHIGQIFRDSEGDLYILSQVTKQMCALICLKSGNRWAEPVRVGCAYTIEEEEFPMIVTQIQKVTFS